MLTGPSRSILPRSAVMASSALSVRRSAANTASTGGIDSAPARPASSSPLASSSPAAEITAASGVV